MERYRIRLALKVCFESANLLAKVAALMQAIAPRVQMLLIRALDPLHPYKSLRDHRLGPSHGRPI